MIDRPANNDYYPLDVAHRSCLEIGKQATHMERETELAAYGLFQLSQQDNESPLLEDTSHPNHLGEFHLFPSLKDNFLETSDQSVEDSTDNKTKAEVEEEKKKKKRERNKFLARESRKRRKQKQLSLERGFVEQCTCFQDWEKMLDKYQNIIVKDPQNALKHAQSMFNEANNLKEVFNKI